MLALTVMNITRHEIKDIDIKGSQLYVNSANDALEHAMHEELSRLRDEGRICDGHEFDVAVFNRADGACWKMRLTLRFAQRANGMGFKMDATAGELLFVTMKDGTRMTPEEAAGRFIVE